MKKRLTIKTSFITLCSLLCLNTALAGDTAKGKALFGENCLSCHASAERFTSPNRVANNIGTLEAEVRDCVSKYNIYLYDPDIKDVASYLNDAYYHFPSTENQ
jgi:mono/diheme cytochrome c family protein